MRANCVSDAATFMKVVFVELDDFFIVFTIKLQKLFNLRNVRLNGKAKSSFLKTMLFILDEQ